MKKFFISLVTILCACTFVLVGCGSKGLKDNPATGDTVIGNGGYVVQKGDYVYFVNGYVNDYQDELTDYKKDNVEGKVTYGAIYRTKLNNGNLVKDEKGFLTNTECVVSKVVGYENGGFYIVGDYIYYATPYMQKNANGVLQNDRISINRININGTSNKQMFVTDADASDVSWSLKVINEKAYVIVKETVTTDEASQKVIKSIADNGKKFPVTTVVKDYSEVVISEDVNLSQEYIYYTRSVNDDDPSSLYTSGNLVCKASLISGGETAYQLDAVSTFKLCGLENGKLYMTKASTNNITCLYAYDANVDLRNQTPVQLSNHEYSSYYVLKDVNYSVIAVDSDNNLKQISNVKGSFNVEDIASGISEVISVYDGYVYYNSSSALRRVDISTGDSEEVTLAGELNKTYLIEEGLIDFDGRYAYVWTLYTASNGETESYYLNRIDTYSSDLNGEFIGYMTSDRMVAEPSSQDDTVSLWV